LYASAAGIASARQSVGCYGKALILKGFTGPDGAAQHLVTLHPLCRNSLFGQGI
jgi:hypothetical protein